MSTRFPFATWSKDRRPLADEALDAERRAHYWDWSAVGLFEDVGSILVHTIGDGRCWREILDEAGADFEAFHMQHSIGYNWDHYSNMGRVLSLRAADGIPCVTVLVAGDRVVHARRKENAPLREEDLRAVHDLADLQGWSVASADRL